MIDRVAPVRGRPRVHWVPVMLGLTVLGVFWPVLFGGRTLYPTDITNRLFLPFAAHATGHDVQETATTDAILYYYPSRVFQASALRAGHLPLWNPDIFGGHPTLASNAGVTTFDPFNLVLLAPNLGAALAWRSVLQVAACIAFMFLFLRYLGLSATASVVGALGYGLNSMFWANIFDWSIAGILWLPLVCLLIDRAITVPSLRSVGLAGLVLGGALLASPLQIYGYIGLGLAGLLGLRWLLLERTRTAFVRLLAIGAAIAFLGIAISAVQMLPTLELLAQSARFAGGPLAASAKPSRSVAQAVLATAGLASFVFPNLAGRLKESMMISGALWGGEAHWQGFVGVVPFLAAVVGTVASRDRRRWPYAALGALTVLSVVYTRVGTILYDRAFLLYIFCAALLAGWGIDAIASGDIDRRRASAALRWLTVFVGLMLAAIVALNLALIVSGKEITDFVHARVTASLADNYLGRSYSMLYLSKADRFLRDLRLWSPHTAVPFVIAALGLVFIHRRLQGRLSPRSFGIAVVAATTVDLAFMTVTHVPMVDLRTSPFAPPSRAVDLIRADADVYRVLSYRSAQDPPVLPLGTAAVYGLTVADGYDDLGPPNLSRLITWSSHPCGDEDCAIPGGSDLANVKYIVTGPHTRLPEDRFDRVFDDDVRVFRSRGVMDRAFWVTSYLVEPDTDAAVDAARGAAFDPRAIAVVDRTPPLGSRHQDGGARVSRIAADGVAEAYRVDAEAAGLLIVSETYYPGWRAKLDGRDVPILRADGVMRAVAVGAGVHEIAFQYAPASLRIGGWVSIAAAAAAVLGIGFGGRRKRDS